MPVDIVLFHSFPSSNAGRSYYSHHIDPAFSSLMTSVYPIQMILIGLSRVQESDGSFFESFTALCWKQENRRLQVLREDDQPVGGPTDPENRSGSSQLISSKEVKESIVYAKVDCVPTGHSYTGPSWIRPATVGSIQKMSKLGRRLAAHFPPEFQIHHGCRPTQSTCITLSSKVYKSCLYKSCSRESGNNHFLQLPTEIFLFFPFFSRHTATV